MSSASANSVTVQIDPTKTNLQADVITGATPTKAGVMTAKQASELASIIAGTVSSVSGTAPIVSTGGLNPVMSITPATTLTAGSMSAADKTKLDGLTQGITSIAAGPGIACTPNPIVATGTVAIAATAVIPGSYSLTNITVGADGRITAAASGSAAGGLGWFNIRDYGAVGDGVTNDSTAFLAAYTAAVAAGGGVVFVPAGNYRWSTARTFTTSGTNDISVLMLGNGSSSRILVDSVSATMLTVSNMDTFEFRGLTFIGYDQGRVADADIVISGANIKHFIMRICSWFGVGGQTQAVSTTNCGTYFDNVSVIGCAIASTDPGTGFLAALTWQYGKLDGCVFSNSGDLGGVSYSKAGGSVSAYVRILESYSPPGATGGGEFAVLRSSFDEGGSFAIMASTTDGTHVLAANAVRVEGCSFLVGSLTGVYLGFVKKAIVRDSTFNCGGVTRSGFFAESCGNVEARNLRRVNGSCTYLVDASVTGTQSVEIIDCEYDTFFPPLAMPIIWITTAGVRSRLYFADGAVIANTLAKLSNAVAGRMEQFLTGDAGTPFLARGVFLDGGADGAVVRVAALYGQTVSIKSDGVGTIGIGAGVDPSGAQNGRVVAGAGTLGYNAGAAVAAVLDDQCQVLY